MEHFTDNIYKIFLPMSNSKYLFDCYIKDINSLEIVILRTLVNIITIAIIYFLLFIIRLK